MKKTLLSIVLLFGLSVFANSVRAQNIVNALAPGYTPQEMESLYKALTPSNYKTYLTDKGFKFSKEQDGVMYYKKNDVVTLIFAFVASRVAALAFESSPQKWYQAKDILEKNYQQISDKTVDGVDYKQYKKDDFIFRVDAKNYGILLAKASDL